MNPMNEAEVINLGWFLWELRLLKGVLEMTQFTEGQDVEVLRLKDGDLHCRTWRKANIVRLPHAPNALDDGRKYETTLGLFDAANIRAVKESRHSPTSMAYERFE